MKLLYLMTEPFGVGGVQSDILALTESLVPRGHQVYVATRAGPLLPELQARGARFREIDFHFRGPVDLIAAMRRLRRLVREQHIEVIAPQSVRSTVATWLSLRMVPSAYRVDATGRRVPIVTTIHNIHNPANFSYAGRILSRCADFVIFESRYERDRVVAGGLAPERSVVIHSGIDVAALCPGRPSAILARRYGLRPGEHHVYGIVARLSPEKGHRFLLEAFARVHAMDPAARLLVVGDGPLEGALRRQAVALGISPAVIFAGLQRDIGAHLALMDVFVLASTRESFPLAAREAMAAGVAVIAPAIGGCPEVVADGETGLLYPAADVAELARCMGRVREADRWAGFGRAGRERAVRLFSRERWVTQDESVYLRYAQPGPEPMPSEIGNAIAGK